MPDRAARQPVDWGVSTRCRRGETLSGDLAIVKLLPDGALVAAVDGLGHGGEAARAARTAERVVRESPGRDLVSLVERSHKAMSETRGAAISLAFVSASEGRMSWLGVGNVEGRVLSGDPYTRSPKGSLALLQRRSRARAAFHADRHARPARPAMSWSWPRTGSRPASRTRWTSPVRLKRSPTGSWPGTGGPPTTRSSWLCATSAGGRERRGTHRPGIVCGRLRVRLSRLSARPRRAHAAHRLRARARGRRPAAERARPDRRPP